MMEEELYSRIAFQYEAMLDMLTAKGLIDEDLATGAREEFYDSLNKEKLQTYRKIKKYNEIICSYMMRMTCDEMVSLTELARQYSEESPGYVIQSWMSSRNTLEFLRQWEIDMNGEFDDRACEDLIHQAHKTSLTVTPSLWIRRTHAVEMHVKQGKGGGVSAYLEISMDFHLWFDPAERLALVRLAREIRPDGETV